MKIINIKSALTLKEINILKYLSRGTDVLEIGSLLGFSTIGMAQTANSVTAIDPHCGYPFYNPSPTLNLFLNNLERYSAGNVIPLVATAQKILPNIKKVFDLVFIDCTGFYEDTKFCLENVNSRIIACHDFGRRNCDGVQRAINEFVQQNNKQLNIIDTLAIIQ